MNTAVPVHQVASVPSGFSNDTLAAKTSDTRKYITFKLADYTFALPSEDILKIVPTPPPSQGGMVSMGLVQLEQYSIQTLNLPKLLGIKKQTADQASELSEMTEAGSTENPPFLMVLQNEAGDLWGIAVHEPPDLMDVPNYALKAVPTEKRLTRTLRWVSHVVTYDLGGDRHTLLILAISILLEPQKSYLSTSDPTAVAIEPPLDFDNLENADLDNATARPEEMYA